MSKHPISKALIRKELSMILDFEEIRNSHVLSKFLEFVVEKKLSGEEDEIKEYTIAVKGLGKPNDYNPQLDASVRIHAGRLRRILSQYYQDAGKDDAVLIDIPKGTYVPIFINRSDRTVDNKPFLLSQQPNGHDTPAVNDLFELRKKPVLAVLPFYNLSADHSNDYIVVGFGEQLSTYMSRFQNISVVSYFTTSAYKPDLKDLQELKEKIHLDYVLIGSVRFVNETMKMNIQLVNAETAEIVFTDAFTGQLLTEMVLDVQDEILNQISNIIGDEKGVLMNMGQGSSGFAPVVAEPPVSVKSSTDTAQQVMDDYFKYSWEDNRDKSNSAINDLEKTIQKEPNNATAMALMADLYVEQYMTAVNDDHSVLDKATKMAYAATDLDPSCQMGQKALAWVLLFQGKKAESLEVIQRCIDLDPKNSNVISAMALAYISHGDYVKGFKWVLESIYLTPSLLTKFSFVLFYFHNKDYVQSLRWLERLAPVETPFLKLVRLSLHGYIADADQSPKEVINQDILALADYARNIIGRHTFDEKLRKEIIRGLQLAGLSVK